jgi:hypothetical protein
LRRNPFRKKKRQKKSIFIYGTTFKKNESGRDFQRGQIWNDRSQNKKRITAVTQCFSPDGKQESICFLTQEKSVVSCESKNNFND